MGDSVYILSLEECLDNSMYFWQKLLFPMILFLKWRKSMMSLKIQMLRWSLVPVILFRVLQKMIPTAPFMECLFCVSGIVKKYLFSSVRLVTLAILEWKILSYLNLILMSFSVTPKILANPSVLEFNIISFPSIRCIYK